MKVFPLFVGTVVAGVLGYVSEPSLRPYFTKASPRPVAPVDRPGPDTGFQSAAESGIDLASLTPSQLPGTVILKEETRFADETSGLTITVAAGSPVKPLRIEGDNLAVRPGATAYTTVVPISKTDLVEQLIANPPPPPEPEISESPSKPEPEMAPEPAPEPASDPTLDEPAEPTAETEPEPEATPDIPIASEEMTGVPDVEVEPEELPQPETPPVPAATPPAGNVDVVAVMQESIRAGQIKEFAYAQVLEWNPGATETVDGEEFQTGLIAYKAETIFGEKTIQAKALIKDGKVQRWIWPKSGMEIK